MDYTTRILSNPPEDVHAPIFIDAENSDLRISWHQYSVYVKRIAVGLRAYGVSDQECVALLSPNDIYCGVLGDGVVAAGAIYAALPASSTKSELVSSCDAAQIQWLFATPQLLEHARSVAKEAGIADDHVLLFDSPSIDPQSRRRDGRHTPPERLRLSDLLNTQCEDQFENRNLTQDPEKWLASRLFTSGTTGSSKAANISHAATIPRFEVEEIAQRGTNVRTLHFVALHHALGVVLRHRAAAGYHCMYITSEQDPVRIVDLIEKHQISNVMMPPRMLIAITELIDRGERPKSHLQSLRFVLEGGSPIPNESLNAFKALLAPEGAPVISYGSTEMGSLCRVRWDKTQATQRSGYVGVRERGVELKIIDPDTGNELEEETDGEICSRGTQLFRGYCNNTEAEKESLLEDDQGRTWFRSGDKGRLTADGELVVTGRYKEVFKVAHEDVIPAEIETVLMKHPSVHDAVVTDTADRDTGHYHEVKAYVVRKEGQEVVAQDLVDSVGDALTSHKAPTGGVTFVSEIPRNAMKKPVKKDLADVEELPGSVGYMDVRK